MRSYRNPFRARTLEQQSQRGIDEFLRVFSPGVIDLLPDTLWDRLIIIRSAPGFGKTSLMNAFTAGVLRTVSDRPGKYRDLEEYLGRKGALEDGPRVVGFRIPLSGDFQRLLDLGAPAATATKLFMRLLDARISSAFVEAVLVLHGLQFPEDAARVQIAATGATSDALARIGGDTGDEIVEASRKADRLIRDLLDSLVPIDFERSPGHARFYSLDVLGHADVAVDSAPVNALPLMMFDDGQKLHPTQREVLRAALRSRGLRAARWYAERYTALDANEVVGDSEREGRTWKTVRLEQATREGPSDAPGATSRSRRFESLLLNISDRRADDPLRLYGGESRKFAELLENATARFVDDDAITHARTRALAAVGRSSRYDRWVAAAVEVEAVEGAIPWRIIEILVARDRGRTQRELFEQIADEAEWERRVSTATREAAALFLARELRRPYYFGARTVARLGSSNIEQFVDLSGDLFEEMLALITLNREPRLSRARQDELIFAASERLWRSIPVVFDYGRDIQRTLFWIARLCHKETYKDAASYQPGVTGVAISMDDHTRLIDPQRRAGIDDGETLLRVMSGAIANNLLDVDLDRSVKGGRWMVLNLNRLLLPRFRLPLQRGSFAHVAIHDLASSLRIDAPQPEDDGQLELPLTLAELQL